MLLIGMWNITIRCFRRKNFMVKSSLMEKMLKSGVEKEANILSKSDIFNGEIVETPLPILNIALSGKVHGGFSHGATVLAGPSKSFKTLLALYMLKAYFDKYEDSVCLFYDTEYGSKPSYLSSMGINPDRIVHIPVKNVEALRFDIMSRFESIEKKDKVIVLIDSLGNIASSKELDDTRDQKTVADMSRARSLKSFWRIVSGYLYPRDIPLIAINHTYKEMSFIPKDVVSGGTGGIYNPDTIFIISKSQEKESGELIGFNFTLNVEKSRTIREKSKLTFTVLFKKGVEKYSGLMDLAIEAGMVVKPNAGWYSKVDPDTGEIEEKKYRYKDTLNADFWNSILESKKFDEFLSEKFLLEFVEEPEVDEKKQSAEPIEEIDLNHAD